MLSQLLQDCLNSFPQAPYPVHSRIHRLRSFHFPSTVCYVKRDDELGFGVSGSKIRKYRTLIPSFIQKNIEEIILIGSAYSNHILSLQQLLIENGLSSTLFLRGDPQRELKGNALLISLFSASSPIFWISKEAWKTVEIQACQYAAQKTHSTFILPEGGFTIEALPGALSLAFDIEKNEQSENILFDHIFIEAGTGFTASALILGFHWLQRSTTIHVILLAEDASGFLIRLKSCYEMFKQMMQVECSFPQNFILHLPQLTKKFGQMTPNLFQSIADTAKQEGILTDPLYTAKLFIESRNLLSQGLIKGNVLIHHAGGALSLSGFQEQLQKMI